MGIFRTLQKLAISVRRIVILERELREEALRRLQQKQTQREHAENKTSLALKRTAFSRKQKRSSVKTALTSQNLVEENFDVIGGKMLRRHYDLMQVTLQQLRDDVSEAIQLRKTVLIQSTRNHTERKKRRSLRSLTRSVHGVGPLIFAVTETANTCQKCKSGLLVHKQ